LARLSIEESHWLLRRTHALYASMLACPNSPLATHKRAWRPLPFYFPFSSDPPLLPSCSALPALTLGAPGWTTWLISNPPNAPQGNHMVCFSPPYVNHMVLFWPP
jgi:hypothetical protein